MVKATDLRESDNVKRITRNVTRDCSRKNGRMSSFSRRMEFLGGTGLEAVRAELLEKILAYNACRIVQLQLRLKEEEEKLAA